MNYSKLVKLIIMTMLAEAANDLGKIKEQIRLYLLYILRKIIK
jgi:hypothetical protein